MRLGAIALLTLSAGVTAAEPNVTFSFASDVASGVPTFVGEANTGVIDNIRVPTNLFVDDANGPLATLEFDTNFYVDFQMTYTGSFNLPSGQVLHTYAIDGNFEFLGGGDGQVMSVDVTGGVLTALGDATSWGSTATIQASSIAGSTVGYTWQNADLPAYNLFDNVTTTDDTDAAFSLTNIFSFPAVGGSVAGVAIDPQTGLPSLAWESEGSYSGSAFFVPAPGTVLVTTLGVAVLGRRRR